MKTSTHTRKSKRHIIHLVSLLGFCGSPQAGDLHLEINNIRNTSGRILISVFDNAQDYADTSENEQKYHTFVAVGPHDASVKVIFPDFPPGTYAVFAIHDENGNNDLDSDLFGTPTEGIGFSNYEVELREPDFKEAAFLHRKEKDSRQSLPLTYFN